MASKVIIPLVLVASLAGLSTAIFYLFVKKHETRPRVIEKNLSIPRDRVVLFIGRGGENIKSFEERSGAHIVLLDDVPACADRTCRIIGDEINVELAVDLIQAFLNDLNRIDEVEMIVPSWAVSNISGAKGENLTKIKRESSTVISLLDCDNADNHIVKIKGLPEQIEMAKMKINEIVDDVKQFRDSLTKREPRAVTGYEKLPDETASSGKLMEVYVSAMRNPGKFWVQIVGSKARELDSLVSEMTTYYSDETNKTRHRCGDVNVGDLVATFFNVDKKCYRAEVVSVNEKNSTAQVFFVDYGDIDSVKKTDLFKLRTDFLTLRFQAIECFLAHIRPLSDKWSDDASDEFETLSHCGNWKKLSAKIVCYKVDQRLIVCYRDQATQDRKKREPSPIPGIELYDHLSTGDLNVADELVKLGLAEYENDSPTRSRTVSKPNTPISSETTTPRRSQTPETSLPVAKNAADFVASTPQNFVDNEAYSSDDETVVETSDKTGDKVDFKSVKSDDNMSLRSNYTTASDDTLYATCSLSSNNSSTELNVELNGNDLEKVPEKKLFDVKANGNFLDNERAAHT